MQPTVDRSLCTGCETCIEVCPADVFEIKGGVSEVVNGDECIECGACEENCPENAITLG